MLGGGSDERYLQVLQEIVRALNAQTAALSAVLPSLGSVSYQQPVNAATLTAPASLSAYELDPAGALAALTIVLPPNPADTQQFAISTTQTITALAVNPPAGETVVGGSLTLNGNSGIAFRFRSANTTWYRVY